MKHFVFIALISAFVTSGLYAQSQKIGYVVSSKIFEELPEALEAQKKLEALEKAGQDTLSAMAQDIQVRIDEYQKKEGMMNDAAKRTAEQEIQELRLRASQFADTKRKELAEQNDRIFGPVRTKIINAIEAVAKEEKYTFVFDKNDQLQILLYGDSNHDVTFKVLDRLKRGK